MDYRAAEDRYETMQYRRVGKSGLQLPLLSLGLWHNFGDTTPFATQREMLCTAFDLGITHVDLANNYGPPYGSAERNFGRHFQDNFKPYRDELIISSKAGYDMWPGPFGDGGSRKYLMRSLEQSLQRMNTDYVDVFYSHRPDPETPLEETVAALADIVRSGKALYVGISNYPAELARRAYQLLADQGVRLLLHQPRYSLFDRTPEAELFPALRELEIGSAVFSPLAQGLLTGKYIDGDVPADSRAANSHFLNGSALTDSYLERIRGIDRVAKDAGLSIPQLAVAWVLRDSVVTTAIIGASRTGQIDDAVAASQVELSDDVVTALEEFAAAPGASVV